MKQVDLDRDHYRDVPKGPYGNPRTLWIVVAFFTVGAMMSGFAGWQMLGPFWGVIFTIPPAMWAGVAVAGLFPGYFFGSARRRYHS